MPQRARLVSADIDESPTVADAVRLGSPAADDDRVWRALAEAGIDEDVRALPAGLDTRLAADGSGFSVGQLQRLALARAILTEADVVLLDEPTAALDVATETAVVEAIRLLAARGATVIVVAHRPALIEIAHQIVRLDRRGPGRASDRGARRGSRHRRRRRMVSPVRTLWNAMSSQRRELALAGVLGAVASASAVALLGVSAWLIATASTMPPVLTLTVAAVLVRTFALSRAVFRYGERIVGHDAAFRGLTELRVVVYGHLERLAPTGLAAFGRGDLLSRLVADVDAALDLPLRVILPWAQAALVSLATVAFLVVLLPPAGVAIGVLVVIGLALTPWLVARTRPDG